MSDQLLKELHRYNVDPKELRSSNQRSSAYETVERIRNSHRHARPNPAENPAWANCHLDCGVLLAEIDKLEALYEADELLAKAFVRLKLDNEFLHKRRGELVIERDRAREALQAALDWAGPMEEAPRDARPEWFDKAKAAVSFRAERAADETTPQHNVTGD